MKKETECNQSVHMEWSFLHQKEVIGEITTGCKNMKKEKQHEFGSVSVLYTVVSLYSYFWHFSNNLYFCASCRIFSHKLIACQSYVHEINCMIVLRDN